MKLTPKNRDKYAGFLFALSVVLFIVLGGSIEAADSMADAPILLLTFVLAMGSGLLCARWSNLPPAVEAQVSPEAPPPVSVSPSAPPPPIELERAVSL